MTDLSNFLNTFEPWTYMVKNSASPLMPPAASRMGLHYFPDTLHYREADLQTWLPELHDLGASWLVLQSDAGRAIPEHFIRGLKQAGIEPVIWFKLSLDQLPDLKELGMLLDVYARWGARYVIFYDRPNDRKAWPVAGWMQQDLVECFLDRYIPVANLALHARLTPVFPPLQPGGSYWDTAFLRSALQAIQRRKQDALLNSLALSAYAWTSGHGLDWGAGGPERWPQARPYITGADSQDQCGFRIFDWYEAAARSVLRRNYPVLLLQAGLPGDPRQIRPLMHPVEECAETSLEIARLLDGETVLDQRGKCHVLESIPNYVIGCNFWLLGADRPSADAPLAWFAGKDQRNAAAEKVHAWRRDHQAQEMAQSSTAGGVFIPMTADHPIRHYLLLPGFEWGISDWYLEVIKPYVKKYRPTVGFVLEEAEKAAWVTVVGSAQNFSEGVIERLQNAGCKIERIDGDGTQIATELAER